jgi:hypothetical protein
MNHAIFAAILRARLIIPSLLGLALFYSPLPAQVVLDFSSTDNSGWTVTGGGAVNVPAMQNISLTSNRISSGTFAAGGSAANFDGFWTADYKFFLPDNATNVALTFSNLFFDDRGVLTLNGVALASTGADAANGSIGLMTLADGADPQLYTFSAAPGEAQGTIASGFIPGGINTIEAIINNTHQGIPGPTIGFANDGDGTWFGVSGTVTYDVPEPSTTTIIMGMAALCFTVGLKKLPRQ